MILRLVAISGDLMIMRLRLWRLLRRQAETRGPLKSLFCFIGHDWVRGQEDDRSQSVLFKWPCCLPPLDPETFALTVGGLDAESPPQDPLQSPMGECLFWTFEGSPQPCRHAATSPDLHHNLGGACSVWRKEGEITTSMKEGSEKVWERKERTLKLNPFEGDCSSR